MDVSASVHPDVSLGGDWPACATPRSGLDVVRQQQLCSAALQRHQCSQPSAPCSWLAVFTHNNPGLLLGCGVVWRGVFIQRTFGCLDRTDH